jgi:hypothetical protein
MKARIFSNWTFTRALYLLIGGAVIIQSVMSQQWFGLALGGYLAAMGLFSFGCASGNCFNAKQVLEPEIKSEEGDLHPDFEEVKKK